MTQRPDGSTLIGNGVCGIIVPSNQIIKQKDSFLAPIQSFQLADGSLTDSRINYLRSVTPVLSAQITINVTPDSALVTTRYVFREGGFYVNKIRLTKSGKSIIIEEDANTDLSYQIQVGNSLSFDRAQYRGWSSTSPELGSEPDGRQYREENQRTPLDAVMDLNFATPTKYPFLSNWDPAGGEVNSGRYWQLYKKSGTPATNMFGLFQGQSSRLIGNKFIGVRFMSIPRNNSKEGDIKLEMEIVRRGPDNSYFARKRFQWCVYISTKKDVLPAQEFQPIAVEMNRVSGVASRVDRYAKSPLQLNQDVFRGAIYMDAQSLKNLIQRIKKDENYYRQLMRTIPSFRASLDAWRYPDSAISLKKSLLEEYKTIRKDLTEGDGTHSFYRKYWMGSINYKRNAMKVTALFADPSIPISASEKEQLIEMMRLMARLQWDDDYVPFFDSSGINFGTANMKYQYRNNGRNFFALLFSNDAEFRARASKVADETRRDLLSAIAVNGITFASPHYSQATIDPILYNMLQLKKAGIADLFMEQKERLTKFIGFYTSLLTPASVRFNGYRKLVSLGDGSEESAPTFALLAAGMRSVDSNLSNNLYYLFENGGQRQSLFGELGLAVDLTKHQGVFSGSSASFNGYLSHMRADVNTKFETAAWVINGETYIDHRNEDRGETVIYALGAPLSLSRSSFYSPYAPDARIRSLVIPERLFPSWQAENQPINGEEKLGNPWDSSYLADYAKTPIATTSTSIIAGKNNRWKRVFTLLHAVPEEPIFIYYDSLQKEEASIWSMNFMCDQVKENASVLIQPKPKVHNGQSRVELPAGTPQKSLKAGWNQFNFIGQLWPKHATGGINWNLYTHSGSASTYSLARWTNNWQNTEEVEEFLATNGRKYEETQDILRWKSSKPFFAVITPYKKDIKSGPLVSKYLGSQVLELSNQTRRYVITPGYFSLSTSDGTKTTGVFSASVTIVDNILFEGGNITLVQSGETIRIFIAGLSGKRKITFPFEVSTDKSNPDVLLSGKGKTMVEINYHALPDPGPGDPGYQEFTFVRKRG